LSILICQLITILICRLISILICTFCTLAKGETNTCIKSCISCDRQLNGETPVFDRTCLHNEQRPELNNRNTFNCDYCEKTFLFESILLSRHRKTHEKSK